MLDKHDLMIQVLDDYSVVHNQRAGWQSVHCPNEFAHARGDRNASARLNLTLGLMRCMGCDLNGDAYSIVMAVESVDFKGAMDKIGKPQDDSEEDWLI